MAFTAKDVQALREKTGVGMMDCKKALVENNEDVEKAIDWLREKGIAKAAKKSSRIAAEGLTYVVAEGNTAVILEINSETDFVAKSDAFKDLVAEVARLVLAEKPACINCAKELTADLFTDAAVKIGEKIDLKNLKETGQRIPERNYCPAFSFFHFLFLIFPALLSAFFLFLLLLQ